MNTRALVTAPVAVSDTIDFDRITKTVGYYTNDKVSSVIFKNGSCVFPPLGDGAVSNSIALLNDLRGKMNFNVREMDDGNFVVGFGEHVFSIVFSDELERLRDDVVREIDQSSANETIVSRPDVSPEHLLIGIIARTRLIQDIDKPVVVASIGTEPA
jgi:hypothetical protein